MDDIDFAIHKKAFHPTMLTLLSYFHLFLILDALYNPFQNYSINKQAQIVQPTKKLKTTNRPSQVHSHDVESKINHIRRNFTAPAKAGGIETIQTVDLTPSEVGIPLEPPYRSVNLGAVELDIPGLVGQPVQVQSNGDLFDYYAGGSPQEIVYEPVIIRRPIYVRPTMPPPKNDCYVNDSGYTCCSANLEMTMHSAYGALKASPSFNDCNIGLMASVVQKAAQKRFRLSFETVVSLKPFGSLSDYEGNYTCKFERDGKYFYTYATPVQYDIEDETQEKALSKADLTHDEKSPVAVSSVEKEEKIEELNKEVSHVKSTGIKAPNGDRVSRSTNEFSKEPIYELKASHVKSRGGFVTFEASMGPSPILEEARRRKRSEGSC